MDNLTNLTAATRVEIIDTDGRVFYGYFSTPGIEVSVQDGGQTVKLFAAGRVLGQ